MNLTYMILNVLQQFSSKNITKNTHPMKRTEIVERLKEEFPDENITYKKVRTALDAMWMRYNTISHPAVE